MARVVYLCTDLLFTSKIRETAQGLGHQVSPARDAAALLQAAPGADLVIVDLRLPSALDALAKLRADAATADIPTVGFCDHERVELMAAAKDAGCDQVLPKGRFSSDLARLLAAGGEADAGTARAK
jgi:CheY-like chemotaxis protein